jgi:hypothetical protein
MKNIHLIPTDKPSRLAGSEYITNEQGIDKRVFKFKLWDKLIPNKDLKDVGYIPQHIYITSDEEIKEDDWILPPSNIPVKYDGQKYKGDEPLKCWKKIILTTDQDLIKDGVQTINDTFLEWFVKNPSCERVEIRDYKLHFGSTIYKIIIPQEEPKQETIEEPNYNKIIEQSLVELRKQPMSFVPDKIMYSEEEVYKLLLKHQSDYRSSVRNSYPLTWSFDIKEWFEEVKKK